MSSEKRIWKIRVTGYGDFEFEGTREEADERANAKARWEGGNATVWAAEPRDQLERIEAEIGELRSAGKGVPRALLARRAALRAAPQEPQP